LARLPIRTLVVTADLDGKMGAAEEVESLRQITKRDRKRMQLTVLESCTAQQFLEAVRDQRYDILHFIGTGFANEQGRAEQAGLVLMPDSREFDDSRRYSTDQVVPVSDLKKVVGSRGPIRLVFLDACNTDSVASQLASVVQA